MREEQLFSCAVVVGGEVPQNETHPHNNVLIWRKRCTNSLKNFETQVFRYEPICNKFFRKYIHDYLKWLTL